MSVENFNPRVTNEEIPFFMLGRDVIQQIDNPEAGFVWVYLRSMSAEWKVIKTHIQKHFKMGEKKIKTIFAWLNAHSLIEYIQGKNPDGTWSVSEIRVLNGSRFTAGAETARAENRTTRECRTNINKQNNTEKKSNKISCPSDDERVKDDPHLFDQFWQAYPKKVGKKAAMKAWKKNRLDEKADIVITDVHNRMGQNWKGKGKQYIPDPATYLNGERWTDELFTNGENGHGKQQTRCEESFSVLNDIHQRALANERTARNQNITQDMDYDPLCPLAVHLA